MNEFLFINARRTTVTVTTAVIAGEGLPPLGRGTVMCVSAKRRVMVFPIFFLFAVVVLVALFVVSIQELAAVYRDHHNSRHPHG